MPEFMQVVTTADGDGAPELLARGISGPPQVNLLKGNQMPEETASDSLSDLRPVLTSWSKEVIDCLAQNAGSLMLTVVQETWQLNDDGNYIVIPVPMVVLRPQARERLGELKSFAALEDAAKESTIIGPMIGKWVGTVKSRGLFTAWNLANAFIPDPNDLIERRGFSMAERYRYVIDELERREVIYEITCPIQGAGFEDAVRLEHDLTIDRLTPGEIADGLSTGAIPLTFPGMRVFRPEETNSFALKKLVRMPILSGAHDDPIWRDHTALLRLNAVDEPEQLRQCLALMTHASVSVTGTMTRSRQRRYLFGEDGIVSSPQPVIHRMMGRFSLNSADCRRLEWVWALSHDESFPQNKALALALRRLAFATERTRLEDRLLDAFIAAEALYLSDSGDARDRGELKYRLALRSAAWSEGTLEGWTKRQVFQQMKRGYDLRSAIAHGGEPKAKDIKVKDVHVTLEQLVLTTEEIIRAGLYKALQQIPGAGKRLSISWDDLLIPE